MKHCFCKRLLPLAFTALLPLIMSAEESTMNQRKSISYASLNPGFDITFTFDKPYRCGQYANGDWWVVTDPETKSVVIDRISPDFENGRNGWCVNPTNQDKQPYDKRARLPFDSTLVPVLPYTAHGDESIVKAASALPREEHSWIRYAAVLTVVSAAPEHPATTFRPPYTGADKRTVFNTTQLQPQFLPALKPPKSAISQETAEARVRSVRLDYSSFFSASDIHPSEGRPSWGAQMMGSDCEVFLWLCLDQPTEKKMRTLIGMVQYGIDLYGARKNLQTSWVHGGGGNGAGRALPMTFAALMLNSSEIKAELKAAVTTNLWGNTFWESEMFYRDKNGRVLWGNWTPYISKEAYWYGIAVNPDSSKTQRDPYGLIDGGSIPGHQYQGEVSLPVKYSALVLRLIPQLQAVWPEKDIRILDYADRWATKGVHTLPDLFAPPVKLTQAQWKEREKSGYGTTWGPDPRNPDDCIRGEGRFRKLHGAHVDGADLVGNRRSVFGDEMWAAYRQAGK